MTTEIELDDLQNGTPKTRTPSAVDSPAEITIDETDQTITWWAYGSTALLLCLAIPMILFPRLLLFASETSADRRNTLTNLEAFLSLNGGIILVALATALLFNIPSQPELQTTQEPPSGHPLLLPLTSACTIIAFLNYNTMSASSLGLLVFLGSAFIGGWGIWTILFAGSSYRSKKTGADKHTSRFLFGNKAAASVKKKLWKEQQRKQR
ncbi:hypothetical protein ABKN59_004488 [Abortiporus biennis]